MRIKIISFNIRCTNDADGHSIQERAPRLATVTEPYHADIIGLQEYTPLWEPYIEGCFGTDYEFYNQYRTDTGWLEAPPILWKKDTFDCLQRGYFWLSDTPEIMSGGWDEAKHNRICLYVILKHKESGTIFTYMNTHFGFGEENQIKSVRLLHTYKEKISSYPTVLTGDFNLNPTSKPYEEMMKWMTDVNARTANDRRGTYHGYTLTGEGHRHIDYCFVGEKVQPIAFEIIDKLVDGKFPSDHYGIFAEVEIK